MKVESIAECSLGAFCNTFDLHLVIIGLENQFGLLFHWPFKTGFTVHNLLSCMFKQRNNIYTLNAKICVNFCIKILNWLSRSEIDVPEPHPKYP